MSSIPSAEPQPAAGRPAFAALLMLLAAATSTVVGVISDISWDASFGRDSFWCVPHVALNFGVIAAALAAAGMSMAATRASLPAAISLGPLRAPLGAAVVIWGSGAMLAASILEIWWSNAYGLGAVAWPPPQIALTVAIVALLGGVLLCGSWRDNFRAGMAAETARGGAQTSALFPTAVEWAAGLLLTFAVTVAGEYSLPNLQRTALFYQVSAVIYPGLLLAAATAGGRAWSATSAATVYTVILCVLVWILPLFPARPLIGPVYQQIDSMLPPRFPLLLLGPAVMIDLILFQTRNSAWLRSAVCGVLFVAVFMALQWNFSAFLLAPASDNWFLAGGGKHWPFYMQIGAEGAQFWGRSESPIGVGTVFGCVVAAALSARLGLGFGTWARRVRR